MVFCNSRYGMQQESTNMRVAEAAVLRVEPTLLARSRHRRPASKALQCLLWPQACGSAGPGRTSIRKRADEISAVNGGSATGGL